VCDFQIDGLLFLILQEERMMAEWNRDNTTIFSESELNLEDPK